MPLSETTQGGFEGTLYVTLQKDIRSSHYFGLAPRSHYYHCCAVSSDI
jgi:hypothetical protein